MWMVKSQNNKRQADSSRSRQQIKRGPVTRRKFQEALKKVSRRLKPSFDGAATRHVRKGELIPLDDADFKLIEREETAIP